MVVRDGWNTACVRFSVDLDSGPGEGRLVASLEDGRFKPAIPSGSLIITLSDINVAGIPLYIEEPESSVRGSTLSLRILAHFMVSCPGKTVSTGIF